MFGDVDGVVVIPKESVKIVLEQSLKKVSEENIVRKKLEKGDTLKKIFAEHGIL